MFKTSPPYCAYKEIVYNKEIILPPSGGPNVTQLNGAYTLQATESCNKSKTVECSPSGNIA